MSKVRFTPRAGGLETIYSDELVPMLRLLRGTSIFKRASHIDPTPDGKFFQIVWQDSAVIQAIGEKVTMTDGCGQPFSTKGQAEAYEVSLLMNRYFKARNPQDGISPSTDSSQSIE